MIKITVRSFPRGEIDESIELPESANALDLFKAMDIRPDNWILVRQDKIIPDDAVLHDGDSIKLLSVISGG